jgi:hypothetical protein
VEVRAEAPVAALVAAQVQAAPVEVAEVVDQVAHLVEAVAAAAEVVLAAAVALAVGTDRVHDLETVEY